MYHNCYYTTVMPPLESSVELISIEVARKCARDMLLINENCIAVDIIDAETDEVVEFITRGS